MANDSAGETIESLRAEVARLREQLAHSERTFQAVFEQVPYPIMILELIDERTYRPVAANPPTLRMLGMTKEEELTGNPGFSPDTETGIITRLRQCLAAGRSLTFDEHLFQANREIWTQATYSPIPQGEGMPPWVVITSFDITEQRLREQEELREHEAMIRNQSLILDELSTPLLAISDRVLVMPLVGAIDSRRTQQIIESLLEGIAQNGADVAILDITGVAIVDTRVANALLQAAQAVKLLGARVILTGIRPEVAQTLVGLGVDLSAIITRNTLQAGIAEALRR
jgi:PAS domain S-box-containing protein